MARDRHTWKGYTVNVNVTDALAHVEKYFDTAPAIATKLNPGKFRN